MHTEQWRSKSPIAITEEIKREAKEITQDFIDYTTGYRCVFLLQRHKEGGETNNSKIKKIITHGDKEFREAVESLLKDFYDSEHKLRIYSACNERDMKKAIRQFRFEQLDAESYGQQQYEEFYLDIRNRFIGCLMQPGSAKGKRFMWDIDSNDDSEFLKELPPEIDILKKYKTPQGWHIITEPFNYTKMKLPEYASLQKDSLILLKYHSTI